MSLFIEFATAKNVRVHVRRKAIKDRCFFCGGMVALGQIYIAFRGISDEGGPWYPVFHIACFGACLELSKNHLEYFTAADGWDDDDVRAATPDFYEIAQFLELANL